MRGGVKGLSGRKSNRDEGKRLRIIEKAWDTISEILHNPDIKLRERAEYAIDIVRRSIPQTPIIDQSIHTHYQFEYKQLNEDNIRASQSSNERKDIKGEVEGTGGGKKIREDATGRSRIDEEGTLPPKG